MKSVAVGVLIFSMAVGSAAMAGGGRDDSRHDGDGRDVSQQDHRDDHHDDHRDDHNGPHDDHGDHHDDHHYGDYHRPKGYHEHHWARGERLPKAYYDRQYVIANYRERGWRAPPRGYHWVRVDHDVVLAAIGTGVVLDVLANQF
jgi:Ni/Co efflux regulator RcnB